MKRCVIGILFLMMSQLVVSQSIYEESINLPIYDSGNTTHRLIQNNGDWIDINNESFKHFFVEPGDYSGVSRYGYVKLTANGSSSNKRTIQLYNGNDLHPGKLNQAQLAKIGFKVTGDNWIIDRMAYWDRTESYVDQIEIHGSHNIINRYYTLNCNSGGIIIYPGASYNTVQNSYIERTDISLFNDTMLGFGITNDDLNIANCIGNKFIQNETYNLNDGLQLVKTGNNNQTGVNFEGTIIDSNNFYIDSTVYTDGSGNHDPNGNFCYAENALDFKAGSLNPDNPMIISNNYMAGYRIADETNSGLRANGDAITMHFNVGNFILDGNIIADSNYGLGASGARGGYAIRNATISNNIFTNIKGFTLYIYDSDNVSIINNLLKNVSHSFGNSWNLRNVNIDSDYSMNFENNLTVNSRGATNYDGRLTVERSNNEWFSAPNMELNHPSDIEHNTDPTLDYKDAIITIGKFTRNPTQIVISKVIKKDSQEPVNANAGSDVSICEGENITLTASGGSTYLWNTGATTA
ncbi:hypothetical protein QWY87_00005, partial [Lutimonas halocynthiae]|uniref:hypothetical protein n=1 Tax=Lutimonas halocynthiae TaxID=1446477 RepID=UPI0025B5F2BB